MRRGLALSRIDVVEGHGTVPIEPDLGKAHGRRRIPGSPRDSRQSCVRRGRYQRRQLSPNVRSGLTIRVGQAGTLSFTNDSNASLWRAGRCPLYAGGGADLLAPRSEAAETTGPSRSG